MRKPYVGVCLVVVSAVLSAWLQAGATTTSEEKVQPMLSQPLSNLPGHSFTSVVVELAPGAKAAPHRHGDAFVYAFVLSGHVRSAIDGKEAQTFGAGQDWFEPPGAHHTLTENGSRDEPARFLAIFVARTGAALKILDRP